MIAATTTGSAAAITAVTYRWSRDEEIWDEGVSDIGGTTCIGAPMPEAERRPPRSARGAYHQRIEAPEVTT